MGYLNAEEPDCSMPCLRGRQRSMTSGIWIGQPRSADSEGVPSHFVPPSGSINCMAREKATITLDRGKAAAARALLGVGSTSEASTWRWTSSSTPSASGPTSRHTNARHRPRTRWRWHRSATLVASATTPIGKRCTPTTSRDRRRASGRGLARRSRQDPSGHRPHPRSLGSAPPLGDRRSCDLDDPGLSTEVPLRRDDGIRHPSVANLDNVQLLSRDRFRRRIGRAHPATMMALCAALSVAVDCGDSRRS